MQLPPLCTLLVSPLHLPHSPTPLPPCTGLIHIFAPNRAGYQAAEARILGLAGESVKVRAGARGWLPLPGPTGCAVRHWLQRCSSCKVACAPCTPMVPNPPSLTPPSTLLPQAGQQYRGRVVRLLDFGAMLELEGLGLRALLHISEVAPTRIRAIDDVLQARGRGGGAGGEATGRRAVA